MKSHSIAVSRYILLLMSLMLSSFAHADKPSDRAALQHVDLDEVAALLADLNRRPGVRMEACSVACRIFGVKTESLLPGIKAVGNTFVSLIGYQTQGYGTIPIY